MLFEIVPNFNKDWFKSIEKTQRDKSLDKIQSLNYD
jgi:hypothetical protein